MRKGAAAIGLGCLALVVVACGGNVVVDGAVTTTATSGSSSGSSGTGAAPVCSNLTGEQLANGGCQADAQCDGQSVDVLCGPSTGSADGCFCQVNGNKVGTCQESASSANRCNPTNGCCGVYFSTSGG